MERRKGRSGRRRTDLAAATSEAGYVIFRDSTRAPLEKLSLHVFARAYRSAWRTLYLHDPVGEHRVHSLDLLIAFPWERKTPNDPERTRPMPRAR